MMGGMWFPLQPRQPYEKRPSMVRSSLLLLGVVCVLFGIAIIEAPELLAYIVATFFIVTGVSLLLTWWKLYR